MAREETRARPRLWPSLRESRSLGIGLAVAISLLAHLVLTPVAGLLGVIAWLAGSTLAPDEVPVERLESIPIAWLGEVPLPRAPSPPSAATPIADSGNSLVTPAPARRVAKPEPPRPSAKQKPEPARALPPEPPRAPPPKPEDAHGDGQSIDHPVALSGVQAEVVDDNANVNLLLVSERLRDHALGRRIGNLMTHFPQWRSFLGSTGVDPVRDFDRILLVGPQFRRSADVVAVLRHQLPAEVIRGAVDQLVRRKPKGRWLKSKIPAAHARADRAERLFALTSDNVLVVAPTRLEKQVLGSPIVDFPVPDGDQALVVHLKTPWRALIGIPFELPRSLEWLRLDVTPRADGGALLRLSALDESPALARRHASRLSVALNAVTNPDLGALGALLGVRTIAFIDPLELHARDALITGEVVIRPRQMDRLMAYAEELVGQWTGEPLPRPSRSGSPPADGSAGAASVPGSSRPKAPALRHRVERPAGPAKRP